MSGPPTGEYYIRSVANGSRLGVNDSDVDLLPIVTTPTGNSVVVTEFEDGTYEMVMEGAKHPRFINADEQKNIVVGSFHPPGTRWRISSTGDGHYTIEIDTGRWPGRGCTVQRRGFNQPVVITTVEIPFMDQKFDFLKK